MCEACERYADHIVCLLKDAQSHWTISIRCYEDDTWPIVIRTKAPLEEKEQADKLAQDPWKEIGI